MTLSTLLAIIPQIVAAANATAPFSGHVTVARKSFSKPFSTALQGALLGAGFALDKPFDSRVTGDRIEIHISTPNADSCKGRFVQVCYIPLDDSKILKEFAHNLSPMLAAGSQLVRY